MDTRIQEYILAIAEEGTVSAAAERLHISQSALSQSLAREEKEFGIPFFARRERKLIPTDAGRIYLKNASEMVSLRRNTYSRIEDLHRQPDKTVIIGICTQAWLYLGKRIEEAVHKEYPEVRLFFHRTDSLDIPELLHSGSVSLGILAGGSHLNGLKHIRLYEEKLYMSIPAGYVNGALTEEQLYHIPFALPASYTLLYRMIPQRIRERLDECPHLYTARNTEEQLRLLNLGYAATILPEHCLTETGIALSSPLQPAVQYNICLAADSRTLQNRTASELYYLIREVTR